MNINIFKENMKFIKNIQDKRKCSLVHDIDIYENFEIFFYTDKLYELIEKTDAWKLNRDFEDIIKRMKKCILKFKKKQKNF